MNIVSSRNLVFFSLFTLFLALFATAGLLSIVENNKKTIETVPIETQIRQKNKESITETSKIDEKINSLDEEELKKQIIEVLGHRKDDYALYVKILNEDFEVEHNSSESFYPASIIKVPIALLVMLGVEEGKYSLDTKLELKDENKHYSTDQLYHKPSGSFYTVRYLIKYMIKYSDNTAWDMLQDNLIGDTNEIERRIHEDLGMKKTNRIPFETTAYDIGVCFEKLYSYEYLNGKNSHYLLDLLSDITFTQNDRLPSGVPEGTKVAHKIGNWIGVYQDAGIIYGEEFDYVLVVLNRNASVEEGREKVGEVSRVVWEYFDTD